MYDFIVQYSQSKTRGTDILVLVAPNFNFEQIQMEDYYRNLHLRTGHTHFQNSLKKKKVNDHIPSTRSKKSNLRKTDIGIIVHLFNLSS